jgi:dihydrofolate reductase
MGDQESNASERRLILLMSASLDGYVAGRDGTIDWLGEPGEPFDSAAAARHAANLEFLHEVGTIVLGRAAHDQMAPAWSSSDSPMARLMNSLPKLVFTSAPLEFEWANARRSAAPLGEEIAALRAEADGAVVCFGGGQLAHSLVRERLVDEYRLTVHPVALGDGLPLWHGLPELQRFRVVGATTWADGAVTYRLRR